MTSEQKHWIDSASFEDLFRHWRFAPVGDKMFQGDVGNYYVKIMAEKSMELEEGEYTAILKRIGWDG